MTRVDAGLVAAEAHLWRGGCVSWQDIIVYGWPLKGLLDVEESPAVTSVRSKGQGLAPSEGVGPEGRRNIE